MKQIVDVVNLNSDASCLSSNRWLEIISGKKNSFLYRWLKLYIKYNKKVSLGLTGASIADMSMFNPETIKLINSNRNIFEIIARPFSHDLSLLRTREGFKKNVSIGIKVLEKEFKTFTKFFLPPEFVLSNEQVYLLKELDIEGVFINSLRFKEEFKKKLSSNPYYIRGLNNIKIKCIPFDGQLTKAYLNALHSYNNDEWENYIKKSENISFSWRDGESSFFIPDGLQREKYWLSHESDSIERLFVSEIVNQNDVFLENTDDLFQYYPPHSFNNWLKELRMLGFIMKVYDIEKNLIQFSDFELFLWLNIINSDILSSVEKDSPNIKIKEKINDNKIYNFIIYRSERWFEGEEYLSIFNNKKLNYINGHILNQPHLIKLDNRIKYLSMIVKING